MDPIVLATATSAISVLAHEVMKGTAGEAGKSIWKKLAGAFGWSNEPEVGDLPTQVSEALMQNPGLASEVVTILQGADLGAVSRIADRIDATNVVIIDRQNVGGDFTLNM